MSPKGDDHDKNDHATADAKPCPNLILDGLGQHNTAIGTCWATLDIVGTSSPSLGA